MTKEIAKIIIPIFKKLLDDESFKEQFIKIRYENYDLDSYHLAKVQEKLLIDQDRDIFGRLNPFYDIYPIAYDTKLDLDYGDFIDRFGNYYDLKVGEPYNDFCGCVNEKSLKAFGNIEKDNHWYVCVDNAFSKMCLINARKLYNWSFSKAGKAAIEKRRTQSSKGEGFIGYKDYKDLSFVVHLT